MSEIVDLLVIGGGINGAGIARDAAGRGLSVMLCEKGDLAEATSSRSGKLVHGGLRYLEYYEFRLVREALIEREVLLNAAPHIIWPMRFVLPHSPDDRPAWLVRLGLFLYDYLGGRQKLPGTRVLDLHRDPEGAPIKDSYRKAFEYSDCWVDDARLVILNALDAKHKGADIRTRTACVSLRRHGHSWQAELRNERNSARQTVEAKAVVNAGGPWVNDIVNRVAGGNSKRSVRLVKGSHIITPKFWQGDHAYLVQNHDKRVIFINPYEGDKALIGTTDIPYDARVEDVVADESEITYLIEAVNRYFTTPLQRSDVIESFAGVRPLFDDGQGNPSAVTRDYVFDLEDRDGLPLLNVFGGKITTFRKLAEHALHKLTPYFPNAGPDWTQAAHLPGGGLPEADPGQFMGQLKQRCPFLTPAMQGHFTRLYGTLAFEILRDVRSLADLGENFGGGLFEAELRYLITQEWAETTSDILERRTKYGLKLNPEQKRAVATWLERQMTQAA